MMLKYNKVEGNLPVADFGRLWGVTPSGLLKPKHTACGGSTVADWLREGDWQRQFDDCVDYISQIPTIKSAAKQSSYGLKHEIEAYNRKRRPNEACYVCNGTAILAMMFLEIRLWVYSPQDINVFPGLSTKRTAFVKYR
jgi:hypothetical protein